MIETAPVHWYDEIDSTSEEAKRKARADQLGPVWLAAKRQTAGRGRLGRRWQSVDGNLYSTFLFPPDGGLDFAAKVPFAAGLAVHDACKAFCPEASILLKWPNDVKADGAKLCGILVETGHAQGALWVALGIGVNVAGAPADAGQAATSLSALGCPAGVTAEAVLEALREAVPKRLAEAYARFDDTLDAWQARAEGLGQTIESGPPEARVRGVFEGLAEDGGLQLRLPDGQSRIIRAGDVELVKQTNE